MGVSPLIVISLSSVISLVSWIAVSPTANSMSLPLGATAMTCLKDPIPPSALDVTVNWA